MSSPTADVSRRVEQAFRADRGLLFALAYRMTGSAADADEIVQETFARALERPPRRRDDPWRPWLVRVAVNLSLDALRRRRRRAHGGPWLPMPVDLPDDESAFAAQEDPEATPAARYERLESASFAFLLALEALTPQQRAVLILADVFEYSAREAGTLLGVSEGNARVVLHRARRALRTYDSNRCRPGRELAERTRRALEELVRCLVQQDVAGVERLLAEDARALTDAGNEYAALKGPLAGRAAVARLLLRVAERRADGAAIRMLQANGLPAVRIDYARSVGRQAPCVLLRCELDAKGRIRELHAVLGPRKLAALPAGV